MPPACGSRGQGSNAIVTWRFRALGPASATNMRVVILQTNINVSLPATTDVPTYTPPVLHSRPTAQHTYPRRSDALRLANATRGTRYTGQDSLTHLPCQSHLPRPGGSTTLVRSSSLTHISPFATQVPLPPTCIWALAAARPHTHPLHRLRGDFLRSPGVAAATLGSEVLDERLDHLRLGPFDEALDRGPPLCAPARASERRRARRATEHSCRTELTHG